MRTDSHVPWWRQNTVPAQRAFGEAPRVPQPRSDPRWFRFVVRGAALGYGAGLVGTLGWWGTEVVKSLVAPDASAPAEALRLLAVAPVGVPLSAVIWGSLAAVPCVGAALVLAMLTEPLVRRRR